jgi:pseudoazurin
MLNNLRTLLFTAAFIFLVTACGDDNSSSQKTAAPPAATPATPTETVTPAAPPAPPVVEESAPATNEVVTEPAPAAQPPAMESSPVAATAVAPATPVTTPPTPAGGPAQTHVINAEARVFNPDIVYIQPGDTVQWINMTSHTSTSIDGLIPVGATPWQGQLGENLQVTLTVVGIYGYYCIPHIGFGMMGVIVVGKPANLAEVKTNADKNLQGPFRRILGKLNKVVIP